MSSSLEAWKAKALQDMTLPSGTSVTIRLPNLRDCIVAGEVPLAVLSRLDAAQAKPEELSPDDLRQQQSLERELVRSMVVAVEGEAVSLTAEDVAALPQDDYTALVSAALRLEKTPKAKVRR